MLEAGSSMIKAPLLWHKTLPDAPKQVEWQIGVFCQNEGGRIADCLRSIDRAVGDRQALISVIINGSTDNSLAAAHGMLAELRTPAQVFNIPISDKSNAINLYIHDSQVRVEAGLYFAVDGYATINPESFAAMEQRLRASPDALIATGIAGNGRNEPKANCATIEVGGVMHGQFYCMTSGMVRRMEAGNIRLPIGLYRGDGLLGNIAAHDLDPVGNGWDNSRVLGVADAVFLIQPLSPFRVRDIRRHFNRKIRQMRGRVENAAIRAIVHSSGFAALPKNADDMINEYLRSHPVPHVSLSDQPFMTLALRRHRKAPRPDTAGLAPCRMA